MIVHLKSILVSVTEGCHVGCAHCGFIGSIRDRESTPSDIFDWVRQVCDYGTHVDIANGREKTVAAEALHHLHDE